ECAPVVNNRQLAREHGHLRLQAADDISLNKELWRSYDALEGFEIPKPQETPDFETFIASAKGRELFERSGGYATAFIQPIRKKVRETFDLRKPFATLNGNFDLEDFLDLWTFVRRLVFCGRIWQVVGGSSTVPTLSKEVLCELGLHHFSSKDKAV